MDSTEIGINLETERLTIRRFVSTDWQDLYEYLSDESVVKYEPYDIFNEAQAKEEAEKRSHMECFFAVCLRDTHKLIGNIYLEKGDFETWEVGYVFNTKYQGMGYATEAANILINRAFTEWGARRVMAMCNPLNTASWKLLERLGMRREGTLLKNIYFKCDNLGNPIWADTYEYAILREEWSKN